MLSPKKKARLERAWRVNRTSLGVGLGNVCCFISDGFLTDLR